MLDALGIDRGDFVANADGAQEIEDDLMLAAALGSKLASGVRKLERAVGFADDEPFAFEPADDLRHRHVGNVEAAGKVDDAALPLVAVDLFDRLDVVLGRFRGVIAADAAMPVSESLRFGHLMRSNGLGISTESLDKEIVAHATTATM
jgi:hypothetical protein